MSNRVIIFDTTLRDGEQSPGATMNLQEKLRMARQLESLGVDVIEAGFPASSVGDFEAVHAIANAVTDVQVAALARCNKNDIDRAWQALNGARNPRIHVFLATSPIHMEYKLRKTPDQVVEMAVAAVRHAAKYTNNVEFSAEDASRSNPDFLVRVFTEVINAGATTINVPDTVGYAQPDEYGKLIKYVIENTPNSHKAVFSVHCHDDLGLAVANSLSAIQNGARQAEVTLCGIGERAGNASLEEIVMAMKVRPDVYGVDCGIQNEQLYPACRLLSLIIGRPIAANKAIVGSKYVLGLTLVLPVLVLSMLSRLFVHSTPIVSEETMSLLITACLSLILMAIDLPFMFHFGVEKGRLIYILLTCVFVVAGVNYAGKLADAVNGIETAMVTTVPLLLLAAAVIALLLSYVISVRVYRARRG